MVLAVVEIACFVGFPLITQFSDHRDFVGLSGAAAKQRLGEAWPAAVDAAAVTSMDFTTASTIDSHSNWYRIRLDENAASAWIEDTHAREELSSRMPADHLHETGEGVNRTIPGPPPLHLQTGPTPSWWSPPAIDFRATEVMLWYTRFESGVARATYSAFDGSTRTLWIYEYAAQHDLLWPHGKLPRGTPIVIPRQ